MYVICQMQLQCLHILCEPLIGNFTGSSCGFVQTKTYGLSDSPFGWFDRYSSCGKQS